MMEIELLNYLNHNIPIIMLTVLPLILLSIEIRIAIKTRNKNKKLRRYQDLVAVTFAIIPLELFVHKSITVDKSLLMLSIECMVTFLLFILVFGASEVYVKYGFEYFTRAREKQ